MRWYGGYDEIIPMCMDYLLPSLCCSMLNYTYLSLCLQAMGNSTWHKKRNLGSITCDCLIQFCSMITLCILLFKGKFVVKPKFNMHLKKFSPHSLEALHFSLSQLIANLASSLPILVLSKLVAQSATNAGNYADVMTGWNVNDRLYAFVVCICN